MNNTIYDIAKAAGVSPSTVSKVINDYASIPEETKKKVRKAMDDMHYVPNVSARSLSKGKSRNVGILAYFGMNISPFKHTLFTEILDSFQTNMNAKGYDLIFISHNVGDKEGTFLKNCISRDVAGVLIFGDFGNEEMQEVIHSSIPKVAFDYLDTKKTGMTGVYSDSLNAMKELTRHIISQGHRNIVFVHGEGSDMTELRIRGFCEALAEAHIPFEESMLVKGEYLNLKHNRQITEELISREDRPTAILYPDDYSALASLAVIRAHHLHVPKDIAITGFDGIPLATVVTPSLTTIQQDTDSIGKILAEELIQNMDSKGHKPALIQVPTKLFVGTSTGPHGEERRNEF